MTSSMACIGHQELRDMVIELRVDVKHIDEKICELVEVAKHNNNRIVALEIYQNQSIGKAKGISTSAVAISVCISAVISIVAIIIGAMV